ncbi:MAG: tRNA (guanosine(46)-N7)-methyltransferase TrmB [Mariprofundales bacterium]
MRHMRLDTSLLSSLKQEQMRTFGRKNGSVTPNQHACLQRNANAILLPKNTDGSTPISLIWSQEQFDIVLEIGFGNGDFLAAMLQRHEQWRILGIEIFVPGVAKAITLLEKENLLTRARLSTLPAQYVLEEQIPSHYLTGVFINHPDPWPKKRHIKRRLIQADFAKLLADRLRIGGFISLASDQSQLAEWMRDVLDAEPLLQNMSNSDNGFIERPHDRPYTKFEQRGIRLDRTSQFLHYKRI